MSDFVQSVLITFALVVGFLVLVGVLSTIRRMRFRASAASWAERRFAPEHRPIAVLVADVLCDELGVELGDLEPQTRFIEDLGMTDWEPVEVLMALEQELGIDIPAEDAERIPDLSALVSYLYERLHPSRQVAS